MQPILNNITKMQDFKAQEANNHTFENLFNSYISLINETDKLNTKSLELSTAFALGETDDMLAIILSQEAAFTALNFTIQTTNRIVQSYQEIVRMQL
jgi:flagellar hook-basal body complex protein FliE